MGSTPGSVAIVLNLAAGRGGGARAWEVARRVLEAEGIRYTLHVTKAPGDAVRLTGQALRDGARTIVSVGRDGGPDVEEPVNLVLVANSRYAGGGMLLAPPASMEDGLLDIIVVKEASRPDILLRLLPGAFRGWHMRHPAVRHMQALSADIRS